MYAAILLFLIQQSNPTFELMYGGIVSLLNFISHNIYDLSSIRREEEVWECLCWLCTTGVKDGNMNYKDGISKTQNTILYTFGLRFRLTRTER